MKKGDYIRITKLKGCKSPLVPTPKAENYVPGAINHGVSLPIDYEVEGYLLDDIGIGEVICVDRRKRNGVEIGGFLRTSLVTESKETITGSAHIVKTQNSFYRVEKIAETIYET